MTVPAGAAVRKNIVPLLGIAFVVAILCTGLFYGAFASRFTASATRPRHSVVVAAHDLAAGATVRREDLKIAEVESDAAPRGMISSPDRVAGRRLAVAAAEGTPILDAVLDTTPADGGIPPGMRALTIHPSDSGSIVGILQPGRRIDIQAWSNHTGDAQIRTILDDVEVLNTRGPEAGQPSAVTVLVPVSKMDAVALADSAAHVRIALRNSDDTTTNAARAVGLTALFRARDIEPVVVARGAAIPAMTVSVLGISEAGLDQLGAQTAGHPGLTVSDLPVDERWEEAVRQEVRAKQAVQVTAARIGGSYGDTVQFGNRSWRFRMRFGPGSENRIWIEPEIVRLSGSVVTTRSTRSRIEPRPGGATAILIGGLCGSDDDRAALAEAGSSSGVPIRDLVIVLRSDAPALRASLPGAGR